jgi:Spy/CpxP family protein refolding chaperone
MVYRRVCIAVLIAGVLVMGSILVAQETKKAADPPAARVKGQLPQNWSKLGLTDQQKQKAYTIQAKYDKEIESLEAQLRELRQKERMELAAVLTEEQKKRLRELLTEKVPGAADDRKPPDKNQR